MAKAERQPALYFIPSAKADGNESEGNKASNNNAVHNKSDWAKTGNPEPSGNEADKSNKADGN